MSDRIQFLTKQTVVDMTTLSASLIDRMVIDLTFPPPVKVSRGRVAWVEAEVQGWMKKRMNVEDLEDFI